MKKSISIALVFFVVLASMHIKVATHFCGGKIAATKVSFTGKTASCGMEADERTNSATKSIFTTHCCYNEISVYAVDNNYTPSEFHFKKVSHIIIHPVFTFEEFSLLLYDHSSFIAINTSPPCNFAANAVSKSDICVFRI